MDFPTLPQRSMSISFSVFTSRPNSNFLWWRRVKLPKLSTDTSWTGQTLCWKYSQLRMSFCHPPQTKEGSSVTEGLLLKFHHCEHSLIAECCHLSITTEIRNIAGKTKFCQWPKQLKSAKELLSGDTNPVTKHSEEFLKRSCGKTQVFCLRQQWPTLCRSKQVWRNSINSQAPLFNSTQLN